MPAPLCAPIADAAAAQSPIMLVVRPTMVIQLEGPGLQWIDGHRRTASAEHVGVAVGRHRERPVPSVLQPPAHVPEAVLVRHELDVMRAAPLVEITELVGGQRTRVGPDLLVPL